MGGLTELGQLQYGHERSGDHHRCLQHEEKTFWDTLAESKAPVIAQSLRRHTPFARMSKPQG
jgi:hypothetical protein